MLTVVLAEQDHLTFINEHQAFLRPFLKGQDFVLCPWNPNARTPELAIPTLQEKVGENAEWRLVVLWVDPNRIHERNPFDVVYCPMPEKQELKKGDEELISLEKKSQDELNDEKDNPTGEKRLLAYNEIMLKPLEDYIEKRKKVLEEAYRSAASKPLTMLATWLCDSPTISDKELELSPEETRNMKTHRPHEYAEYLQYRAYHQEILAKEAVRKEIRKDAVITIHKPKEFYCLTFRTIQDEKSHIINGWKEHEDLQYSHFTNWNMYFDNMRFLLYDIPEKTQQDYWSEYISFIYSLLIFATNPHPSGIFNTGKVYKLECEANREILEELINNYEGKLKATQDILVRSEQSILAQQKETIRDKDVRSIFLRYDPIDVSLLDEEGKKEISIEKDDIGLSVDHPKEQEQLWISGRRNSDRAFRLFMRLPVRAVEKAADVFRVKSHADLREVGKLNHFQIHDVEKYVEDEELQMLDVDVINPEPAEKLEKRIKESGDTVLEQIRERMSRKLILTFLLMTMAVTFLSTMVMFLNMNGENQWSVPVIAIMVAVFTMAFALVGLGYLLYGRYRIRKAYDGYNQTVLDITNEVHASMKTYTEYLSHACDVMRGNHVVNYYHSMEDPAEAAVRTLRKHRMDIEKKRIELREVYGQYLVPHYKTSDEKLPEYFEYDFTRGVEYSYDIVYSDSYTQQILFLKNGNYVEIPIGFIKSIVIRREEIYE